MTTIVRSHLALFTAVLFLAGYSLMSANWTAPSGTPPIPNAPAPLNVSATTQTKNGNLIANVFAAASSTWSPEYCDEVGSNCWDPATGAPGGGGGLGVGQSWRDVTGSRVAGVWYTNNTGKPIAVWINVTPGDGALWACAPGCTASVQIAGPDRDSGTTDNLYGIIPDGHRYYQSGRQRGQWSELR